MRAIIRDWRYSAFVALAAGIVFGVNLLLFAVVKVVILDPMPYRDAERLVEIKQIAERSGFRRSVGLGVQAIHALQRRTEAVQSLFHYVRYEAKLQTESPIPIVVEAGRVGTAFFDTLGLPLVEGRPFGREEGNPGRSSVAVVRRDLWKSLFGDQPLADQIIRLDGRTFQVIGIAPQSLEFPRPKTRIWLPMALPRQRPGGGFAFPVLARLSSGMNGHSLAAELAGTPGIHGAVEVVSLKESQIAPFRPTLIALLGVAAGLLLMVCFSIANLSVVRVEQRSRSLALREVLGASRSKIVAGLAAESLLLCAVASVVGWILARTALPVIVSRLPYPIPRIDHADLIRDGAWVMLGMPLLLALGLTLIGAFLVNQIDSRMALSGGERMVGRPLRSRKLVGGLLLAEVAVSLTLVHSAFLLAGSYWSLAGVETGFDNSRAWSLRVSFPPGNPEVRLAELERILARLRGIPSVGSAGVGTGLPLSGTPGEMSFRPPGLPAGQDEPVVRYSEVDGDFIKTLGMRFAEGSFPAETGSEPVVLVNQRFAREFLPAGQALDQFIGLGESSYRVAGVLRDVRQESLDQTGYAELYFPLGQGRLSPSPFPVMRPYFVLDVRGPAGDQDLLRDVGAVLSSVEPQAQVLEARTMEDRIEEKLGLPFFWNAVIGTMALIAFLLALAGIYSVSARASSQRFSEFGVRLTVGALPSDLSRLILRAAAGTVMLGVAAGILLTFVSTRLVAGLLFGLDPGNMLVFVLVVLCYAAVSLIGAWLPAVRASRTDPLHALRTL